MSTRYFDFDYLHTKSLLTLTYLKKSKWIYIPCVSARIYKVQVCVSLSYYLFLASGLTATMLLVFLSKGTDIDTVISCLELLIISRAGAGMIRLG